MATVKRLVPIDAYTDEIGPVCGIDGVKCKYFQSACDGTKRVIITRCSYHDNTDKWRKWGEPNNRPDSCCPIWYMGSCSPDDVVREADECRELTKVCTKLSIPVLLKEEE